VEVHCKRCNHWNPNHGARQSHVCPGCEGGLSRRKGLPPSPSSHFKPLVAGILSLSGIILLAIYALMEAAPIARVRALGAAILYVGAIKLAWRAMNTEKGVIRFPELDPRGFLSDSPLGAVLLYVLLFVWVPAGLVQVGASADMGGYAPEIPTLSAEELEEEAEQAAWQKEVSAGRDVPLAHNEEEGEEAGEAAPERTPSVTAAEEREHKKLVEEMKVELQRKHVAEVAAAKAARKKLLGARIGLILLAAVLLLYAAMALVLFLRSNTGWGMFDVRAAFHVIKLDPRGYFTLSAIIVGINAVRFVADLPIFHSSIFLVIPVGLVKGFLTLVAYGLCGLYVRQHARVLGIPCDEEDWEPFFVSSAPATPAAPAARAPTAPAIARLPEPAPPPPSPAGFQVFGCRFAGRAGALLNVVSLDGRAMTLAPSQIRLVAAGVVTGARTVLITDVVMHAPPPNLMVLRFTSDSMALDSVMAGMAPQEAHKALMAELLSAGAQAWPSAQALSTGAFQTFPSEQAMEQALYVEMRRLL